jgi:hypothetical protein
MRGPRRPARESWGQGNWVADDHPVIGKHRGSPARPHRASRRASPWAASPRRCGIRNLRCGSVRVERQGVALGLGGRAGPEFDYKRSRAGCPRMGATHVFWCTGTTALTPNAPNGSSGRSNSRSGASRCVACSSGRWRSADSRGRQLGRDQDHSQFSRLGRPGGQEHRRRNSTDCEGSGWKRSRPARDRRHDWSRWHVQPSQRARCPRGMQHRKP